MITSLIIIKTWEIILYYNLNFYWYIITYGRRILKIWRLNNALFWKSCWIPDNHGIQFPWVVYPSMLQNSQISHHQFEKYGVWGGSKTQLWTTWWVPTWNKSSKSKRSARWLQLKDGLKEWANWWRSLARAREVQNAREEN